MEELPSAEICPQAWTLPQLFTVQVAKTPKALAVVYADIQLSYAELNRRANQLAHYLRANYQLQPDDLVGLCLQRSEYCLIAILGVLKAGAAYVPIDPADADKRICYVLQDIEAKVLLTDDDLKPRLKSLLSSQQNAALSQLVAIDNCAILELLQQQATTNPPLLINSTNLAYLIYTSGTTGRPKGVMIEHGSVINEVLYLVQQINAQGFAALLTASYAFDAAVEQMWLTWLSAGVLHLVSYSQLMDAEYIDAYIVKQQIQCLNTTPSYLSTLLPAGLNQLSWIILGGEALTFKLNTTARVYNTYGPTEATIVATSTEVYPDLPQCIGKAIANVSVYILADNLQRVPSGAIGEIYIGGSGIARGYFKQAELTAEKFIANPWQTVAEREQNKNSRLYKTGDLARYLADGNIEYIGRQDMQVKINGYRIELNEIEVALKSYSLKLASSLSYPLKQSVVLALMDPQEKTPAYLVAYYVATQQLDETAVMQYLATILPAYMLPRQLVQLTALPLMPSGKIERKALPIIAQQEIYLAPDTELALAICNIYATILGLNKVGMHCDFFAHGGNSILAIKLVTQLRCHLNLNATDIFKYKTPYALIKNLAATKRSLKSCLNAVVLEYHNPAAPVSEVTKPAVTKAAAAKPVGAGLIALTSPRVYAIKHILLTGASGFLGCNILAQLLKTTNYTIHLLIRAVDDSGAYQRIKQKYLYYFAANLDRYYGKRLFVLAADLKDANLLLSKSDYLRLTQLVDSVLHCAALVKHYGAAAEFYQANVQATRHLLEFSLQTRHKDFHFISTISVVTTAIVTSAVNSSGYAFSENDDTASLSGHTNIYVQSKFAAEMLVLAYRRRGITSSIYRVDSLAMISSNGKYQENLADNALYHILKTIFSLGMIYTQLAPQQISPVDQTAQAVVRLFDKQPNQIYHVCHHHLTDLVALLAINQSRIKQVTLEEFVAEVYLKAQDQQYSTLIELFMLHMQWLEDSFISHKAALSLCHKQTNAILTHLGFRWKKITPQQLFRQLLPDS